MLVYLGRSVKDFSYYKPIKKNVTVSFKRVKVLILSSFCFLFGLLSRTCLNEVTLGSWVTFLQLQYLILFGQIPEHEIICTSGVTRVNVHYVSTNLDEEDKGSESIEDPDSSFLSLTGLQIEGNYIIHVTLETSGGESERSDMISYYVPSMMYLFTCAEDIVLFSTLQVRLVLNLHFMLRQIFGTTKFKKKWDLYLVCLAFSNGLYTCW